MTTGMLQDVIPFLVPLAPVACQDKTQPSIRAKRSMKHLQDEMVSHQIYPDDLTPKTNAT